MVEEEDDEKEVTKDPKDGKLEKEITVKSKEKGKDEPSKDGDVKTDKTPSLTPQK